MSKAQIAYILGSACALGVTVGSGLGIRNIYREITSRNKPIEGKLEQELRRAVEKDRQEELERNATKPVFSINFHITDTIKSKLGFSNEVACPLAENWDRVVSNHATKETEDFSTGTFAHKNLGERIAY